MVALGGQRLLQEHAGGHADAIRDDYVAKAAKTSYVSLLCVCWEIPVRKDRSFINVGVI